MLRKRYDGYHFVAGGPGIYNPFSLLNTFKYMRLSDYWFETGTPTYLVELLKRTNYDLYDMANTETDADVLNSIDSASNNPIPVIYQSGYLTIKDYEPEFKIYRLGFPNQEVEEGFMKYLLPFYTNIQASKSPFEIGRFVREVRAGDYDAFFHRLQSFFADTSYEAIIGRNPERDTELHYRNVLFIVFKLVGLYTQVEYHTSNGRIDLVLQTDRYVYIMEFKLNGNRRGGSAADRGERLCPTLRRRRPGGLKDRREFLLRDPEYREVAGRVKKSYFYPYILTWPTQYIFYARRRYTSSAK